MPTLKYYRCGRNPLRTTVLLTLVLTSLGLVYGPATGPARAAAPAAGSPAAGSPAPQAVYRQLVVDETRWDSTAVNRTRSTVSDPLRKGTFGAGQQAVFDDYYLTYVLARWSLVKERAQLPRFRQELERDFLTAAKASNPAVFHHLNDLVLSFLAVLAKPNPVDNDFVTGWAGRDAISQELQQLFAEKVKFQAAPAAGDCHPAVRINAILMIGRLNASLPARLSDPPAPLPAALDKVLLPALTDPNQIDGVRAVALVGILRHARLKAIAAPNDARVRSEMLKILAAKNVAGRSAAGNRWFRARAADVLGELGPNGAVVTGLAGVIGESSPATATAADQEGLLSVRCAAAGALGKFNLSGAAGLNVTDLAIKLGQLAVAVCDFEDKAAEFSRGRLKGRLMAVSDALAAITPLDQAAVGRVQTPLKVLYGHVDDRRVLDEEVMEKVNEALPNLRNALTGGN